MKVIQFNKSHLKQPSEYIPVTDDSYVWIRNPFTDWVSTSLSLILQEEGSLAELSTDSLSEFEIRN